MGGKNQEGIFFYLLLNFVADLKLKNCIYLISYCVFVFKFRSHIFFFFKPKMNLLSACPRPNLKLT